MEKIMTDWDCFQEIILNEDTRKLSVPEWRALVKKYGFWEEAPGYKNAPDAWLDRLIQKWLRKGGYKDKHGKRIEFFNVVREEKEKDRHRYIQLKFMNMNDFKYVILQSKGRFDYFGKETRRIYDLAVAKFGHRFERVLPPEDIFDDYFPREAPADDDDQAEYTAEVD